MTKQEQKCDEQKAKETDDGIFWPSLPWMDPIIERITRIRLLERFVYNIYR